MTVWEYGIDRDEKIRDTVSEGVRTTLDEIQSNCRARLVSPKSVMRKFPIVVRGSNEYGYYTFCGGHVSSSYGYSAQSTHAKLAWVVDYDQDGIILVRFWAIRGARLGNKSCNLKKSTDHYGAAISEIFGLDRKTLMSYAKAKSVEDKMKEE